MYGSDDTVANRFGSFGSVRGDSGLAFAAFVFGHAGCGDELVEIRLGEDLLTCWCPQCDETRTFGTATTFLP